MSAPTCVCNKTVPAPARDATAIDERLHDVTNLGNMSVRRNDVAVRQNKTRKSIRMGFEDQAKIRKFHADLYSFVGI